MKNVIKEVTEQPSELHSFISKLMVKKMRGVETATFHQLTPEEMDWLLNNGFKPSFDARIWEWEVKL